MRDGEDFARTARVTAFAIAFASLAACVGPRYERPHVAAATGYTAEAPSRETAAAPGVATGESQRFAVERDVQWQWWTLFRSPALSALIEEALRNSPSVRAAQAALRQSEELVAAQKGFFYPTIGAEYNFERQKVAGNLANSVAPGVQGNGSVIAPYQSPNGAPHNHPLFYNFHTAQLTVGYAPDVFGANLRQVQTLAAQADAQRFELYATDITLAASIVAAAIQEAELRDQLATTREIVEEQSAVLEILRNQLKYGYATRADVAAQEAQLAADRALLPPLEKSLAQTRDLLRVLVGHPPSEELSATFRLGDLVLPVELPLSLPAQLLEQRPDVRAAEAQVRAANAQVGAAIAARLPEFTIAGSLGGAATQFTQMWSSGGPFWTLIGDVTQPVFAGGTLLHRQRAAQQALIQAAQQYQGVVLAAYQDVADTLHAIESDADALAAAADAERAARVFLEVTERQRQTGLVAELALLQAQQAYRQAVLNREQAQALRLGDTAALFVALGGGWWNQPPAGRFHQPPPSA